MTTNLSLLSNRRIVTSGMALTPMGRKLRSPMERDMAKPPIPCLSITRSGPPRIHRTFPFCMMGMAIWSTLPPAAKTRSRSSGRLGLWSLESSTAEKFFRAVSQRPSTALESPTLATKSWSRCWYAATAVHPDCTASREYFCSISCCVLWKALSKAPTGLMWRSLCVNKFFASVCRTKFDMIFPLSPCPSKTPTKFLEPEGFELVMKAS
mmetsp:Transcript_67143/g.218582  ORF Transcript_67143/g.218582 Transcript_67143/m.218582 type:complete len:209 (+) Transcript_67143:625-1251(+)